MKAILFCLSMLLLAPDTFAASSDANLKKKHKKIFAPLNFLTVNFDQQFYKALRRRTINRRGKAYFAKPGNFRWNFVDPKIGDEEYYFDGKVLSIFRKGDGVVTHYGSRSGFSRELQQVVDIVLDPGKLMKTYNYKELPAKTGNLNYLLSPKASTNTDITNIHIRISEQRRYIKRVKIQYDDGKHTTFSFKNPRINRIPASDFRFKNPGGVKEKSIG